MKRASFLSQVVLLAMCSASLLFGQSMAANDSNSIVPRLVRFSGSFSGTNSKALTGTVGVTFSLYKDSDGGAPVWVETQNVQPDSKGHYSVLLGSTKSDGVTADLFASGEARWLGVQAQGQAEQPRVLMVSVPYALKAVDAETLGGKPASAFQLALPQGLAGTSSVTGSAANPALSGNPLVCPPAPVLCGAGTANFIPVFTGARTQANSIMQQTPAMVGIFGAPVGPGTLTVHGHNVAADKVIRVMENNGIGIDVEAFSGTGIFIEKGSKYGVVANAALGIAIDGNVPYNSSTSLEGVRGLSSTDNTGCPLISGNDGCAGVVGVEKGAINDTVGVYGYTASSVGAGVYGQSVSPSSVLQGPPPDPSAAVWGDSSQQFGILGTSDSNTAVFGLNATVNDPTSPTAYFENDSTYDTDVVFQTSGAYNPNAGGCIIDTAGDLSCDRTVSAQNISTGSGGGNTDLAGSCTLASGTCTQPFSLPYTTTPICVATDTTTVSAVQVVVTTSSLTINGASGDVANYVCIGQDSPPPNKIHHGTRKLHRRRAGAHSESTKRR